MAIAPPTGRAGDPIHPRRAADTPAAIINGAKPPRKYTLSIAAVCRAEPSVQKSAGKYSTRHWSRKYYDGHRGLSSAAFVWRPRPLRARLLLTEP